MSEITSGLFDTFDRAIYLLGTAALLFLARAAVDSIGVRKWWQMETWRERWARWNRKGWI